NLIAHASKFRLFTQKHLTFHVGMELVKNWGSADQVAHNRKAYRSVLKSLEPHLNLVNMPGASLSFFTRHFKWLMNPTYHYPTLLRLDLQQWNRVRKPKMKPEVSGMAYKYQNWLTKAISFPEES
ncbi:MAG: hypothetical protein ACRCYO_01395, partial [Bacteroidia bacterium]